MSEEDLLARELRFDETVMPMTLNACRRKRIDESLVIPTAR